MITEAQVEAAAEAVHYAQGFDDWGAANFDERTEAADIACAALEAARAAGDPDEIDCGNIVVHNNDCRPDPKHPGYWICFGADAASHAQAAAPVTQSTYINPKLPAWIRGLYDADLTPVSIKSLLNLAADLVQELIDLKSAAPVVDVEKLEEALRASWEPARVRPGVSIKLLAELSADYLNGVRSE